jgi:hypothetical protein
MNILAQSGGITRGKPDAASLKFTSNLAIYEYPKSGGVARPLGEIHPLNPPLSRGFLPGTERVIIHLVSDFGRWNFMRADVYSDVG